MKTTCCLILALSLLAVPCAAQPAGPVPTISPEEIVPGQKGYGLSVFAGTEPQRFEAEVLGVQRNARPEMSFILARLTGHDLERSGVLGGMSGSPVFIDGRLAGAVAYSYTFSLDAIAIITPIGSMRELGNLAAAGAGAVAEPSAAAPAGRRPVSPVGFEDLVKREFSEELVEELIAPLRPRMAENHRTTVVWSAGGFGGRAAEFLRAAVGELTPWGIAVAAGSASGEAQFSGGVSGALRPGGAVAAVLVRGDVNLAAHGTVTDVDGDEILAFGHPLFGIGPVTLPMAASEVVTVFPSRASSFKMSNAGPIVGAFDEDRLAGTRGLLGAEAPMIPLKVRLGGLVEREFKMEVVDEPLLHPGYMAMSALSALDSGSYTTAAHGLDMKARFELDGYGDLVLDQSFDGQQPGFASILYLWSFGVYLAGNGLADVDVNSVEVEFTQTAQPRTATLVAAHAERTRVRPGETARLVLELQAYRGGRTRRVLEFPVPPGLADGRYILLVGDGTTMDAVRLNVEQRAPQSFEQALAYLRGLHSRRELTLFGVAAQPGLAIAGEALPRLPASVRSIFAAGPTAAGVPLSLAIVFEQSESLEHPISGIQRVDLEVKRR